jgi:hypothetical protein
VGGKGGSQDGGAGGATQSHVLWLLLHQIAPESGNSKASLLEPHVCIGFGRAPAGADFGAAPGVLPKGL